jgi:hypothetical protein
VSSLHQTGGRTNNSAIYSHDPSRGGRRYRPYTFTEQGVAVLVRFCAAGGAIEVNIAIMRKVRRNHYPFRDDFLFQLSEEEAERAAALRRSSPTDGILELLPPQAKRIVEGSVSVSRRVRYTTLRLMTETLARSS